MIDELVPWLSKQLIFRKPREESLVSPQVFILVLEVLLVCPMVLALLPCSRIWEPKPSRRSNALRHVLQILECVALGLCTIAAVLLIMGVLYRKVFGVISCSSPYFNVYLASQVKAKDQGFLSKDVHAADLIAIKGDIHHLFPKEYLKKNGFSRGKYNQIANYVYMQSEINIQVGSKSPRQYFETIKNQIADGKLRYGGIASEIDLRENMRMNCIPDSIMDGDFENYDDFLHERRRLMAEKMRGYYLSFKIV